MGRVRRGRLWDDGCSPAGARGEEPVVGAPRSAELVQQRPAHALRQPLESQEDECREVISLQRDGGNAAAVDAHLPRETPSRLLPRLRIQTKHVRRQCNERTAEGSNLEVVQKETVTNGDLAVVELVTL